MAELADAHGSGSCDSNIMRVQVPSSARRLKSKDLSLFRYYIFTTFSSIQAKFYWHILARSLATIFIFAQVHIIGTFVPFL